LLFAQQLLQSLLLFRRSRQNKCQVIECLIGGEEPHVVRFVCPLRMVIRQSDALRRVHLSNAIDCLAFDGAGWPERHGKQEGYEQYPYTPTALGRKKT
jgi:hypothetical protein